MVGDVTDKGVPAALVMAATRSVLRASAQRLVEPGETLERVNEHLCPDMPAKMFVTCLYGVLDPETGHFRFANAGHDLPYVKTAEGSEELRARGMPLGLMPGMPYEEKETVLAARRLAAPALRRRRRGARPRRRDVRLPAPQAVRGRLPRRRRADRPRALRPPRPHRPGRRAGGRHHDGRAPALAGRRPPANGAVPADVLAEFEVPSAEGNERLAIERVVEAVAGARHRRRAGSSASRPRSARRR